MIAYYKLDSLRSLMILSNLKNCAGEVNNIKFHYKLHGIQESDDNAHLDETI